MKTTYKEYGCTASITDKQDGTARLIVRNQYGQKVKDRIHKNVPALWQHGVECAIKEGADDVKI